MEEKYRATITFDDIESFKLYKMLKKKSKAIEAALNIALKNEEWKNEFLPLLKENNTKPVNKKEELVKAIQSDIKTEPKEIIAESNKENTDSKQYTL